MTDDYPSDKLFNFAKRGEEEEEEEEAVTEEKRPKEAIKRKIKIISEKKIVAKMPKLDQDEDEGAECFDMNKEVAEDNFGEYSENEKCVSKCISNQFSFKIMTKRNYSFIRLCRKYTTKKGESRDFTIDMPVQDFENLCTGVSFMKKNKHYQRALLSRA